MKISGSDSSKIDQESSKIRSEFSPSMWDRPKRSTDGARLRCTLIYCAPLARAVFLDDPSAFK
jgi:hypothetical protein